MGEYRGDPRSFILEPGYWGGVDIFNDGLENRFGREFLELKRRPYVRCARALHDTLIAIDNGNYSEVKYAAGLDFNPTAEELPDGTVVVTDVEQLALSGDIDEARADELHQLSGPIFTPYADYWKVHYGNLMNGVEVRHFPERSAVYDRRLYWGVLHTDKRSVRAVQQFRFFYTPSPDNFRHFLLMSSILAFQAIKLPLNINEIETAVTDTTKTILRLRQVDIIYPAKSEKSPRRLPNWLGKTALHPGTT